MRNLIDMSEILRDRSRSSIRLVMNPERMVIKEAQRTFTYLNLYGYLTDAVVVNRVFPEDVEGGYFAAWREVQQEQWSSSSRRSRPCRCCARRSSSRRSWAPEMLERLGEAVFGASAPAARALPRPEPGADDGRRQRRAAPARAVRREGRRSS